MYCRCPKCLELKLPRVNASFWYSCDFLQSYLDFFEPQDMSNAFYLDCIRSQKNVSQKCREIWRMSSTVLSWKIHHFSSDLWQGRWGSSQGCFKESWNSHKAVHTALSQKQEGVTHGLQDPHADALARGWMYCLRKGQSRSSELPNFDWTG